MSVFCETEMDLTNFCLSSKATAVSSLIAAWALAMAFSRSTSALDFFFCAARSRFL